MEEPKISPIPSEDIGIDKRFLKLKHHEGIMKPPFTCAVLGGIGAGKTSFGFTALNDLYANYYDETVVICGTLDSKQSWEKVKQRNVVFLSSFHDVAFQEYLDDIEKVQEERKAKNKYPLRICLVLDDVVFEGMNKYRQGLIDKLFMTCRHFNISIIIMLQHSKQISAGMRNQIMYWVLFRVTKNDLEKIASEHGNLLNDKQFINMYNDIQQKGKHEFLMIDYKSPMNTRFRHRFYTIIDQEKYKH